MSFTLEHLAELTDSDVKGDNNLKINNVATLEAASKGDISFISNPKYKKMLNTSNASAIILSPSMAEVYSGNALINNDPYLTFAKVVNIFYEGKTKQASIHPSAVISKNAVIGESVTIGSNAVIESNVQIKNGVIVGANSSIGENSVLHENVVVYPNVSIYSETIIGANSIIHSGAVIGADGFGFAPQKDKSWYKILQVGNVVIGADVEVGAGSTIDRAAMGSTEIGNGVKIDNQIQIAHNVKIGDHSVFAAGTLIAGSTIIGKYCQVAGGVAIAGHLQIADNVIITGKTMVIKSIKKSGVYSSGLAADESKKWRRNAIRFNQLDDMAKTIKQLESKLKQLEEK